ncbi:hypothetical protein L2E82_33670 [Cichorium intybus]|uniref:Uncharacterized protein n=1 Tax=Cichorium intybus TaxID=13427 RepID=A0ACB9BKT3_CICIN|nr:hypothetical protein L2E82_33670 [Cichorium intybus]
MCACVFADRWERESDRAVRDRRNQRKEGRVAARFKSIDDTTTTMRKRPTLSFAVNNSTEEPPTTTPEIEIKFIGVYAYRSSPPDITSVDPSLWLTNTMPSLKAKHLDVDDPHTFTYVYVSSSDPILVISAHTYYPRYAFGAFGIFDRCIKSRVGDELPKATWLVSKIGRLTAGVQYDPQFHSLFLSACGSPTKGMLSFSVYVCVVLHE